MAIVTILLGVLLLFYGRTLFWAFVAIAGFLVGFQLATELLAEQAEWVRLVVAALIGIVGAVLGILFQRIAFALGGLFAGGYLGLALAQAADAPGEPMAWFIVGGILGAIVAALVMDWAIIALSSLAGAAAIVDPLNLDPTIAALLFLALAAVGITVQARRLRLAVPTP